MSISESEQAIIGAVLLQPQLWAEVAGEVEARDFSVPAYAATWEALAAMDAAKRPFDSLTVVEELERRGKVGLFQHMGGIQHVNELAMMCVIAETAPYHARKVARAGERRRWAVELRALAAEAQGDADDEEFFEQSEARLLALLQQRRSTAKLVTAKQGLRIVITEVERRHAERDKPITGVCLGLPDFDRVSRGLKPKQLAIVAARPSVGKSAFMGNVAEHVSSQGFPVLVFSLEMGAEEIFERMIAAGGVSADRMRTGYMHPADFVAMTRTASQIATQGRIYVDDTGDISIAELRSRARRWRANEGKGEHALVCVDYLQLVRGTRGKQQKREEEVAEVSRGLKALAKELLCPVLALAQLNREVEKRGNKRPTLADLRESGQVEQDADIAAFLYREEIANPECKPEDRGTAELIVAKGRNMQVGTVRLVFQAEYQRFRPRAA